MFTFEFVDRPADPPRHATTDKCVIMRRGVKIGFTSDAHWAQKIVDALNKADAS